jgi:hypothetical protein
MMGDEGGEGGNNFLKEGKEPGGVGLFILFL